MEEEILNKRMSSSPSGKRSMSSLVYLTKKFVKVVKSQKDGIADMQLICQSLQVPKRRIYDITNVLEGIGLIRKRKAKVYWCGPKEADDCIASESFQLTSMKNTLRNLIDREKEINEHIQLLGKNVELLQKNETNVSYNYVTRDDLLKCFKDKTTLIMKNYKSAIEKDNSIHLKGMGEGRMIDVRLVKREGDTFIRNADVVKALLKKYKKDDDSSVIDFSRRNRILHRFEPYKIYRCTMSPIPEEVLKARYLEAKMLLKSRKSSCSIASHYRNDQLADFPLMQVSLPWKNYNFSLIGNEGICELFDVKEPT